MHIKIRLGDITNSSATAIVNAANTSLLGGGGVDGAIHRAAGKELLAECRELHGCKTGQAKITKGYQLKAEYVIHTPGPRYWDGRHEEAALLESCYRSCAELAMGYGIYDIAFPSISTGIFGYPLEEAAEIAVNTLHNYPQIDITFVCFDERTKAAYEQAEAVFQRKESQKGIFVEYCHLPMKLAFQNSDLRSSVAAVAENKHGNLLHCLESAPSTFCQLVRIGGKNSTLPQLDSSLQKEIFALMRRQDEKKPVCITAVYPYLESELWSVKMREVSYIKVDVQYAPWGTVDAEQIRGSYCADRKCWKLEFFYETEEKTGENKQKNRQLYLEKQSDIWQIMKRIFLEGTLNLDDFFRIRSKEAGEDGSRL